MDNKFLANFSEDVKVKEEIKMDEFCRGCLNNFNDPLELLQYTEERRRLFVYSTGLQVKRNDAFTFQLCKDCYFSMKTSCKFKKMCRTSDRKIKSYLALKDVDEGMDFTSFLKKHEETLTFRLPMLSGSSTPANNKARDDDNVSTCTSIQNFMTDILRADEIPDTEARIIKEVIEEEADVLEDSLDSHWLQDDASVHSDFQLDLSFSKFSTPHSTNHERMSSEQREITSTDITSGEDYDNIPIDSAQKKSPNLQNGSYMLQNVLDLHGNETNKTCVIDKNLEKALRNENNKEFSLEEILTSPSAFQQNSGASTPTIRKILFGDKLDDIKKVKSSNFEPDLDILLGKLDNGNSKEEKLPTRKNYSGKFIIDEVVEKKLELGKVLEEGQDETIPDRVKMLQHHSNVTQSDAKEENGHTSRAILQQNHNAINFYVENLDKQLITIKKETLPADILNNEISKRNGSHKDKNTDIEKLQMGKIFEETVDLENFKMDLKNNAQFELNKGKTDKSHDSKVELMHLSIDMLLESNSSIKEINTEKLYQGKHFEICRKSLKSVGKSSQGDDSTDEILKEFFENDKGKSCNLGKKGKCANLDNTIPIDDAELTELLEDAYDGSVAFKGKKSMNYQNPTKDVETLKTHSQLGKETYSPVEKKYCITNFYCKMCNKKFKNLVALKIHFKKCHSYSIKTPKTPREYPVKICDYCGKSFRKKDHLLTHIQNHENPTEYSCEKCTLTFSTPNALKTHMLTHTARVPSIPAEKNGKYVCAICGAISSSSSNLSMHQRRHTKSYTVHCAECGKGFYRNTELATHMRHHTGEKPYECTYCDASFSRRDILNRHMKCHTAEKLFSCQVCDKKFARSNELKKHQINTCHREIYPSLIPTN